jgi:hypothetical protein
MYNLWSVGEKAKTCDNPACINLGIDISFSTQALNFRCKTIELMNLIK